MLRLKRGVTAHGEVDRSSQITLSIRRANVRVYCAKLLHGVELTSISLFWLSRKRAGNGRHGLGRVAALRRCRQAVQSEGEPSVSRVYGNFKLLRGNYVCITWFVSCSKIVDAFCTNVFITPGVSSSGYSISLVNLRRMWLLLKSGFPTIGAGWLFIQRQSFS